MGAYKQVRFSLRTLKRMIELREEEGREVIPVLLTLEGDVGIPGAEEVCDLLRSVAIDVSARLSAIRLHPVQV